ncbi:hypothetical protein L596_027897 [Steinernema carpocapsae]|uniref:Uncharacterized protein n=1 Tax=Steinernema carpocapsae TaxID=34508 RepID=A0A4U5LWU8_STECR|nr:hypothetical protein L596_027897 [Steinernema carpocapsae]
MKQFTNPVHTIFPILPTPPWLRNYPMLPEPPVLPKVGQKRKKFASKTFESSVLRSAKFQGVAGEIEEIEEDSFRSKYTLSDILKMNCESQSVTTFDLSRSRFSLILRVL